MSPLNKNFVQPSKSPWNSGLSSRNSELFNMNTSPMKYSTKNGNASQTSVLRYLEEQRALMKKNEQKVTPSVLQVYNTKENKMVDLQK